MPLRPGRPPPLAPACSIARLRQSGRDSMVREDIRARKAIELVADAAKPIPKEEADARKEQAEAREKILAPEQGQGKPGGLWTPGSE